MFIVTTITSIPKRFMGFHHQSSANKTMMQNICWIRPPSRMNYKFLSTSKKSTAGAPSKAQQQLATIRLYRILQRTCRTFPVKNTISIYDNKNKNIGGGSSGGKKKDVNNDDYDEPFLLQPMLEAPDWGRHSVYKSNSQTSIEELYRLFYIWNEDADESSAFTPDSIDDWYYEVMSKNIGNNNSNSNNMESLPPLTTTTCWTTKNQLSGAIRNLFRLQYDNMDIQNLHKWSIRAIQMLQEQRRLWTTSSVAITEQIRVTATSRCIGTTSPTSALPPTVSPGMFESKYRFAYRVRIENLSDQNVQLLGRHWHIQETTEDGKDDESRPPVVVDAPVTGAVGHLPVLRPGQVFEYMSGTDLATPRGIMKGHFYMARVPENAKSAKSGDDIEAIRVHDPIEVAVAPFPLMVS